MDRTEKHRSAMGPIGAIRATLGRRPLIRLAVYTTIALLTLGLMIVYSHKWQQSYITEMSSSPSKGESGQRDYHPPSSGPAVPPGIPPPLTAKEQELKDRTYWQKSTK